MGASKKMLFVLCWLAIVPASAFAQGTIAGVVRDSSGAVLPGVTVDASSPALIEKVRSVITDPRVTMPYRSSNVSAAACARLVASGLRAGSNDHRPPAVGGPLRAGIAGRPGRVRRPGLARGVVRRAR